MAKSSKPAAKASKPLARTSVRNSPIPQIAAAPRASVVKSVPSQKPASAKQSAAPAAAAGPTAGKAVSHELIARRAYEIWASGHGASDLENWLRAERELRGI